MAAVNSGKSLSVFEGILLPHLVKGHLSHPGSLSTQSVNGCMVPREQAL